MKTTNHTHKLAIILGTVVATFVILGGSALAQTSNFTNFDANGNYADPFNWDTFTVPDLSTGATGVIGDGAAVTYNPGGDLMISNGGELEISSGSWTQINGPAYIQLGEQGNGAGTGNGTILVDGGTFNQGSASSTPFNITGTGNLFKITSGVANINTSFSVNVGLTYNQSGGTVNSTGEFDFDNQSSYMSGGILNTTLITGVNSGGNGGISEFFLSGGTINMSNGTGVYGGNSNQTINFVLNSTGIMSFNGGTSIGSIDQMITGGSIEYNGTYNSANTAANLANFQITTVGNDEVLSLIPSLQGATAAPEPSTYAMMSAGLALLVVMIRRRAIKNQQ